MTDDSEYEPDSEKREGKPAEWVVQDANILIDLFESNLLGACIEPLGLSILVPDVVVTEIRSQSEPLDDAIKAGHITSVQLSPDEVVTIAERQAVQSALSFQDHAAMHIAESRGCTLLTGDRKLRRTAEAANVEVHGLLWIMSRLADAGWDRSDLHAKLSALLRIGKSRLPKKECERLLAEWEPDREP